MSFAVAEGKDTLVFMTKQDHENPQKTDVVQQSPGIIYPSGEINWDCPCLDGLASSPCAETFKKSFTCFYYSKEEAKGSDCLPEFVAFKECMEANEDYFRKDSDEEKAEDDDGEEPSDSGGADDPSTSPRSSDSYDDHSNEK